MKKTFYALCAIILVGCMLFSFAACGAEKNTNLENAVKPGVLPNNLMAEKVGTILRDDFRTADGGLYYQDEDSGKYGIMSYEGNHDTGAKYASCDPKGMFFEVSNTILENYYDIKKLNSVGLVNGKGELIIPMAYASFRTLSDCYIQAIKVTERVYDIEEAFVFYTDRDFAFSAEEGDVLYTGDWVIYDLRTGKPVNGLKGTGDSTVVAYGDIITYNDENGNRVYIDKNGKKLPDEANVFDDGSYAIESKVGTVYNSDGTVLFEYDIAGFKPVFYSDYGYYTAKRSDENSVSYVVMDSTGKVVSAEFDDTFTLYGNIIHCQKEIYNFEGKKLIPGTYSSVEYDKIFGTTWMLYNEDRYTMILEDGSVLFEDDSKDDTIIFSDNFVAKKQDDDFNSKYYSHKDKDYTIEGTNSMPWLITTPSANNLYNLVSSISNETLFENYSSYSHTTVNETALYVYAKYNGGTDVYLIVNEKMLEELMQKKENLLNDLIETFKNEGINVTVNKETGELSLDSSVLFGGDSSELTDAGKTFIKKFIKAYASIVLSDEYDGFIAKTFIEGHTAPVEGSSYTGDMQLSVDRATNVKNYCLSPEVGTDISKIADKIEAVGYSNSKPVYDANGNADMAASRRVSFRFMLNIDI